MNHRQIYTAGSSPAVLNAAEYLRQLGYQITNFPGSAVTHVLLDIPSMGNDGNLKNGLCLKDLQKELPNDVTWIGGNLPDSLPHKYDLLKDSFYVSENAAITAQCAMKETLWHLPVTLNECSVLILGWGRIGKCLASLMRSAGAGICVAARKETDRALLTALGYDAIDYPDLEKRISGFRVILNTVPAEVIPLKYAKLCSPDCVKIDLASKPGIWGDDVIRARGLPGKLAAETSGHLIAATMLRYFHQEEESS